MAQLIPRQAIQWTPIGQTSNQLILYHPPSHALSVRPHPPPLHQRLLLNSSRAYTPDSQTPIETIPRGAETPTSTSQTCPYCFQPLPTTRHDAGYFQILERAHEGSRPPSPDSRGRSRSSTPSKVPDGGEGNVPARGYYERYFREECRLGMGAEGSVYLATHIIGGNVLGQYAVKKIAVGTSKTYLIKILREVRLLETLRHPNIIPYHHSWIDQTRFSSFGQDIMALHVLMMYATAGNLDTFLQNRTHAGSQGDGVGEGESLGGLPREERIKAFKKRRQSRSEGVGVVLGKGEMRGVMMLGVEEVVKLFGDVVEGLAFLHANSILHLDLKCSNVLLHWEEGQLIPKALISDFGTSEEMIRGKKERTGHTGTMEYMAPETLLLNSQGHYRPSDSHADMWSLGLILHKLLFLHLPYTATEDFDLLQVEITRYPGFIPSPDLIQACERRHIPRDLLLLLSKLVNIIPEVRPSAEKVKMGIRAIQTNHTVRPTGDAGGLITRLTRPMENMTNMLRRNPSVPADEKWRTEMSPVRSILALPGPDTLPPERLDLRVASSQGSNGKDRKRFKALLFATKILSIHPSISPIVIGRETAVALSILALACFAFELDHGWQGYVEWLGGGIHVLVLLCHAARSKQGEMAIVSEL